MIIRSPVFFKLADHIDIIITMDTDSNTSPKKLADIRGETTPGNDDDDSLLQKSMVPDSEDELEEEEDSE